MGKFATCFNAYTNSAACRVIHSDCVFEISPRLTIVTTLMKILQFPDVPLCILVSFVVPNFSDFTCHTLGCSDLCVCLSMYIHIHIVTVSA